MLLTWCAGASAEMYRWVDENGVTVYSQKPPPSGNARVIRPQAGPSAAEVAASRARENQAAERLADDAEDRMKAEEASKKDAEEKARKAQNCAAARKNLETMSNLGSRMVANEQGEYSRPTMEQRQADIRAAEEEIKRSCN